MGNAALSLGLAMAAAVMALSGPLGAAELGVRTHVVHPRVRTVYCGPCGCLGVAYELHRELRSTYGLGFDPRNYDTTQPRYYSARCGPGRGISSRVARARSPAGANPGCWQPARPTAKA